MPALESHTGLLRTTIPFFNRRNFVNISYVNRHYSVYPALRRNAMKAIKSGWTRFQFGLPTETFSGGGTSFKFNVQVTTRNNGAWVSEDDPVTIDKRDFQVQGELPWRLARVQDFSYGDWELSACKGKEELINLTQQRTLGNEHGACDFLENWFWNPPAASTDDVTAFPLRYYIYTEPESTAAAYNTTTSGFAQVNSTAANDNLMNLNHNSYTSGPAGISRATYRRWGNWNCQYTNFTDADLVEKVTYACLETDWHSPIDYPNLVKDAPEKAVYTTEANLIAKARLARQQNDANSSDLVSRYGDLEMFRVPWYAVPHFTNGNFSLYSSAHKDPVYGLDWNTIYWASKTGFRFEDKIFGPSREAPHTTTHARFLGGQLVCLDPSRNFVLSK